MAKTVTILGFELADMNVVDPCAKDKARRVVVGRGLREKPGEASPRRVEDSAKGVGKVKAATRASEVCSCGRKALMLLEDRSGRDVVPWCGYIAHRYDEIRDDVSEWEWLALEFPCLKETSVRDDAARLTWPTLF